MAGIKRRRSDDLSSALATSTTHPPPHPTLQHPLNSTCPPRKDLVPPAVALAARCLALTHHAYSPPRRSPVGKRARTASPPAPRAPLPRTARPLLARRLAREERHSRVQGGMASAY